MAIKNLVCTLLLSIISTLVQAQATEPVTEQSSQSLPSESAGSQTRLRPAPATTSLAQAEATLLEVARQRALVTSRYEESEQVCYTRFFVSQCLDAAKEIRRASLADLHAIEVEANHFKRAYSVEQRDRALAEQDQKNQEDMARRAALAPKAPLIPGLMPPAPLPPPLHVAKKPAPAAVDQTRKRAEKQAEIAQRQAQEAAKAGQRDASVAAFELKQRTSLERQRQVATKLAAKQAAAQAAATKAAAEAAAAAAVKK